MLDTSANENIGHFSRGFTKSLKPKGLQVSKSRVDSLALFTYIPNGVLKSCMCTTRVDIMKTTYIEKQGNKLTILSSIPTPNGETEHGTHTHTHTHTYTHTHTHTHTHSTLST